MIKQLDLSVTGGSKKKEPQAHFKCFLCTTDNTKTQSGLLVTPTPV